MTVLETIKTLDEVSKDLKPLKDQLRNAVILVGISLVFNFLALVLYYLHIVHLPLIVILRIILGMAGLIIIRRVYKLIKRLEQKYKAP